MTHEVEKWDAEDWLQQNKDIWNHPMVTDRTDKNAYEVADLMADFANHIINKQKQKTIDMKQTAVEWLIKQLRQLAFNQKTHLGLGDIRVTQGLLDELHEQAKEIEEQQRIDAIKNELKLIGNYFDVSKLETKEQGHHIRFTAILKDRFDYYNETYGGNKQECQFEPDSNLTSATKCKWCGQEKWQHKTYGGNK